MAIVSASCASEREAFSSGPSVRLGTEYLGVTTLDEMCPDLRVDLGWVGLTWVGKVGLHRHICFFIAGVQLGCHCRSAWPRWDGLDCVVCFLVLDLDCLARLDGAVKTEWHPLDDSVLARVTLQ